MENKKDPHALVAQKKCNICKKPVMADQFGQGECGNCKWNQGKDDGHLADQIVYPNPVSFARAKQLFKEGKPMKPNFDEFIEGLRKFLHYEFAYKQKIYHSFCGHGNGFELFEGDSKAGQSYPTIEEFKERANINGRLLKDLWDEVEDPFYY